MGPVPETATIEWGIPASDLMTQFYIVYEAGTETYEPAPHEHAGGMACSICQEGGTPGFLHAYVPSSTSRWLFDFNARYG